MLSPEQRGAPAARGSGSATLAAAAKDKRARIDSHGVIRLAVPLFVRPAC